MVDLTTLNGTNGFRILGGGLEFCLIGHKQDLARTFEDNSIIFAIANILREGSE